MTTLTPDEVRERVQSAWLEYRDALQDLSPEEYEEREPRSWDELQLALQAVEDEAPR